MMCDALLCLLLLLLCLYFFAFTPKIFCCREKGSSYYQGPLDVVACLFLQNPLLCLVLLLEKGIYKCHWINILKVTYGLNKYHFPVTFPQWKKNSQSYCNTCWCSASEPALFSIGQIRHLVVVGRHFVFIPRVCQTLWVIITQSRR